MILDRKRFDGAVRSGEIVALGKMDGPAYVSVEAGAQTAPLVFDQRQVRSYAKAVADDLAIESREHRATAKLIAKKSPPLTRRQIATHLGKKQTGILVRAGVIEPYGSLTDTQTAAHTYDPTSVADAIGGLAYTRHVESKLLLAGSKTRIPA